MTEAERAEQGHGYAVNAPYYDLISPEAAREALVAALDLLPEKAGAVAEIGPGTGHFTEALLARLGPDAEIFAIEPARIMRAALVTRLAGLPAAAERVTVLPEDALTAQVDAPLDGVVLFNLVMHFAPADRACLWKKWAEALRPGGVLLMESQYPQTATAVPPSLVPGRRLGRYRYETLSRADVAGEDLLRWVTTYRTLRGDEVVREESAEFDCHVVSDDTLAAELSAAGLERHPAAPEGVQAWRRPDPGRTT
ncbi:class I SAM-dependent methyltransferase [Nonomuraea terrae]|uniref:class I SAM-dependent methyltransferase n=1 Tax=Nonomuraea terrae TaxID=2530383 RepID=UPI0037BC7460